MTFYDTLHAAISLAVVSAYFATIYLTLQWAEGSTIMPLIPAAAVGAFFYPLRRKVQSSLDAFFFKTPVPDRSLIDRLDAAFTALPYEGALRESARLLVTALPVRSLAIYAFDEGLDRYVLIQDASSAGATATYPLFRSPVPAVGEVIVPLRRARTKIGLIALAPRRRVLPETSAPFIQDAARSLALHIDNAGLRRRAEDQARFAEFSKGAAAYAASLAEIETVLDEIGAGASGPETRGRMRAWIGALGA